MEDWNWQQIIGLVFMIVGGTVAIISGLALLATILSPKYSFAILIGMMLVIGIIFWTYGKKKGD